MFPLRDPKRRVEETAMRTKKFCEKFEDIKSRILVIDKLESRISFQNYMYLRIEARHLPKDIREAEKYIRGRNFREIRQIFRKAMKEEKERLKAFLRELERFYHAERKFL